MKTIEQNTTTLINDNLTNMKTIEKIQDQINTLEKEALKLLNNTDINLIWAKKHAEIKNKITELKKELYMQREWIRLLEEKFEKLGISVNIEKLIIDIKYNISWWWITVMYLDDNKRITTNSSYQLFDWDEYINQFNNNEEEEKLRSLVLDWLKKYLNKKIEEENTK